MSAPVAEAVRTAPLITGLSTRLLTVPLLRSWGAEAPENHVIATGIHTDDGGTGYGFSWTPTIGPQAVKALLDFDIAPFIAGLAANPETVWDQLWKRLHEAGGGGLTTIAMAGVDLALWDLQARRAGTSVTGLLGQRQDSVEVYGSGVNLHYSLEELVAQAERWVAAGHSAVKIKVGKPDIREDAERVAAVRQVLGPDRKLMIDANQRWDLPATFRALEVLGEFGLDWLEEPLRADDLWAYRRLRQALTRCPSPWAKTCTTSTASATSSRPERWTSSSPTSSASAASRPSAASWNWPARTASGSCRTCCRSSPASSR